MARCRSGGRPTTMRSETGWGSRGNGARVSASSVEDGYRPATAIRTTERGHGGRHHHHHRRPHRQDGHGADQRTALPVVGAPRARPRPARLRPGLPLDGGLRQRRSPTSTATPASCATAATRSSSWPSSRPTSRSPTSCSTASCRTPSSSSSGSTTSPTTRSSTRTCASGSWRASTTTPTRWACSCRPRRAVDVLPRGQGHLRRRQPRQADPAAHRQDADARRLLPPLQRRHAVRLPGQRRFVHRQLPQHDVEGRRVRGRPRPRAGARRAVHPPRRPRAELRHHGHARGRLRPRRPVLARPRPRPPRSTARSTAAPTSRSCACSPRSARSTTCRRSSTT